MRKRRTNPMHERRIDEESWLERVDPRVKLLVILATSLLAVVLENPRALAVLGSCALLLTLTARLGWKRLRPLLLLVLLATWGTVFSQALFYVGYPRTVLMRLIPVIEWGGRRFDGVVVTKEGIVYGLTQALRLDAMMLVGTTLCLKTGPEKLFLGLTRLGVPYGLSFMAVTALRFVPTVVHETRTARTLRRLRGYRFRRLGFRAGLRLELSTLKPVLVKSLRRATQLATALSLRAFDPLADQRDDAHRSSLSLGEKGILAIVFGLTSAIVIARALFLLYLHRLYYREDLRALYAFARDWL